MEKNLVLVSGAVIFKEKGGKLRWFIIENSKGGWEIPKVVVRKGESSVRAALRMTGEKGGMSTRVLEEIARTGGVTTINGRALPQRHIYYLMRLKFSANEVIGFENYLWLENAKAIKKITSKREKLVFKDAKKLLAKLKKEREIRNIRNQPDFYA